jgi:hypothetical protein
MKEQGVPESEIHEEIVETPSGKSVVGRIIGQEIAEGQDSVRPTSPTTTECLSTTRITNACMRGVSRSGP